MRPDWAHDSWWDTEKNEIKGAEIRTKFDEYSTRIAAEDSRKASLPPTAEAYQIALPEDFKPPAGVDFKFDVNDPLLATARAAAHAEGLTQGQFSKMLGMIASSKIEEFATYEQARTKNLEGLGSNAPQRIDAVTRWLTSSFGDKAKPIVATLATKEHVEAFESIISKLTSQGAGSFSQQHREVESKSVDDATWNKMTYGERKAYAAKHSGQAA